MRRREFITLLGGAAVAWPLVARAQQAKSPIRIGMLPFGSPSNAYDQSLVEAFRSGLRQAGLIEGRDIVLDIVWTTGGDADKAVAELIHRGVELLVPTGSTASVATKRQTSTIPIVFISVGNPVAMGLVENLAHPGGNATGKNRFQATEQAAQSAGVKLRPRGIAESAEIDQAIMKRDGATTIIVQPSPFTYGQRRHIIDTASHNGLATLFGFPVAARDGALIAYGPDYIHMNRRAPFYVDRILKGIKPADLPVELPTKIDLLVNLTTAKTLGIEVPLSLLIRADELIE
jgi:putative tryptophan/tyrosine transport system substrate-binding protein